MTDLLKTVFRRCALLLSSLLLGGCSDQCQDKVKGEYQSLDSKYTATLFERDCGATTDFSTVVSMREARSGFNSMKGAVLVVKGQPQIEIQWIDSEHLRITCVQCQREDIYKQEKSWRGVKIAYD